MNTRRKQRIWETWKIIRNPNARRLRKTDNYTYLKSDFFKIYIRNDSTDYNELLFSRLERL